MRKKDIKSIFLSCDLVAFANMRRAWKIIFLWLGVVRTQEDEVNKFDGLRMERLTLPQNCHRKAFDGDQVLVEVILKENGPQGKILKSSQLTFTLGVPKAFIGLHYVALGMCENEKKRAKIPPESTESEEVEWQFEKREIYAEIQVLKLNKNHDEKLLFSRIDEDKNEALNMWEYLDYLYYFMMVPCEAEAWREVRQTWSELDQNGDSLLQLSEFLIEHDEL